MISTRECIAKSKRQKVFVKVNLRNFEYLIQDAFIGIWRNGIMAIASISTIALSMAILGAFLLLAIGSHRFADKQLASFQIAAFLQDGASQSRAEEVRAEIAELPLASKVVLKSRDAEWAEFKQKMNADLNLSGVIGNPLPYAINIESKDPYKTSVLVQQIRKIKNVDYVEDSSSYTKVKALAGIVRALGTTVAIILCFTTILIISNAIRLTMFARRQEIRIMQLVGATNWFIRVPLVIEGIVFGAIGACIAGGLIAVCSDYIGKMLSKSFPLMLRDMSSGVPHAEFAMTLAIAGALVGALGSIVSIRRFLKV